jgi:hypothetical protein
MKKILVTLSIFSIILSSALQSCAPTKAITDKSGAQLWGENCNRCHNAPSPDQYNKDQWDVAVTHMKIRAMITDEEANKILDFLIGRN